MQPIQNPRVQGVIQRMFGIKGPTIAPTLSPEIVPVAIVDSFERQGLSVDIEPRLCMGGGVEVNGNAANRARWNFFNPVTSNTVARIIDWYGEASIPYQYNASFIPLFDALAAGTLAQTVYRSTLLGQAGALPACTLKHDNNAAALAGVIYHVGYLPTSDTAHRGWEWWVYPGDSLSWWGNNVGVVNMNITLIWEESSLGART